MKQIIIFTVTFLFLVAPLTGSTKPKKSPLRWNESHGEIILDSICEEFPYGSIDYRECRAATKRLFGERCREFQEAVEKTGGAVRESNQQKRDMYCRAESQFGPVN